MLHQVIAMKFKKKNVLAGLNTSTGHWTMPCENSSYVRLRLLHDGHSCTAWSFCRLLKTQKHSVSKSLFCSGFSFFKHFNRKIYLCSFFLIFKTVRGVWVKRFYTILCGFFALRWTAFPLRTFFMSLCGTKNLKEI